MIVVTNVTYYDEITETGGGGIPFLFGAIGDKIRAVIDFYVKWSVEGVRLSFDGDVITIANDLDFETDFIAAGFKVGDTIAIEDSPTNDGNYTITAVEGRTLVCAGAGFTTEIAEEGSIFGTTPVTDVDFYYNLIANNAVETYESLIDKGTQQKYYFTELDASDMSPEDGFVATKSWGWVTHSIKEPATGETDDVTITGAGISDHKQSFQIDQIFLIPMWMRELFTNYQLNTPPDYLKDGNSLKHIFRIDAKYERNQTVIPHTVSYTENPGQVVWYDTAVNGKRNDYYLESIEFNGGDSDTLQFEDDTEVNIVLKSRAALFQSDSKIFVRFVICPMDTQKYIATQGTMLENLFFDLVNVELDGPAQTGFYITNCEGVLDDPETANITFSFEPSTELRDYMKAQPEGFRAYTFWAIASDLDITTTKDSDHVAVLCKFGEADYNKDNEDLVAVPEGILCYEFPETGNAAAGDVNGYEGDRVFIRIPFQVETAESAAGVRPIIEMVGIQVVAVKEDEDDFVLEEKLFDTASVRQLLGVQPIDIDETRGLITYEEDPYNFVKVFRNDDYDDGTLAGFELQYGLILRYESWRSPLPLSESEGVDIFKYFENVTQQWSEFYNNGEGWELKLRFRINVRGYDGHVTEFYGDTDITVRTGDENPDEGPVFTTTMEFISEADPDDIGSVVKEGTTLVRATFNTVTNLLTDPMPADTDGFYATMFADIPGTGSIFTSRFASSEIPSEDGSPWSAPAADPLAAESHADGNIRINIFANKITVEGYFNSNNFNVDAANILFYPRIGFKPLLT